MRQQSETCHVLMMRKKINGEWSSWLKPIAGRYRPAEMLAYQGRLIESLETAMRATIQNYGNAAGVQFRIETTTKTVTTLEPQED